MSDEIWLKCSSSQTNWLWLVQFCWLNNWDGATQIFFIYWKLVEAKRLSMSRLSRVQRKRISMRIWVPLYYNSNIYGNLQLKYFFNFFNWNICWSKLFSPDVFHLSFRVRPKHLIHSVHGHPGHRAQLLVTRVFLAFLHDARGQHRRLRVQSGSPWCLGVDGADCVAQQEM